MSDLGAPVEEALLAAARGSHDLLDALLVSDAGDTPAALLAGLGCWWYSRPGARLPREAELRRAAGDRVTRALVVKAGLLLARASLLAFDRNALDLWHTVATDAATSELPDDLGLALRLSSAWRQHLCGDDVGEVAREIASAGASAKVASVLVEATALRALAALAADDLEGARDIARRASRMGRTEALPESEYLANVVLARVRRVGGEPHLAARILSALAARAPRPWHGWLAWELMLSGGPRAARPVLADRSVDQEAFRNHSGAAAMTLGEALGAAQQGARARFDAAAATLGQEVAGHAPVAREAEIALQALDASRPDHASLRPWRQGMTTVVPLGLYGLASDHADDGASSETVLASVVAAPGEAGRRVLSAAVPLFAATGGVEVLSGTARVYGRTDAALAALALAGPAGVVQDEFFRTVYGFAYAPNIHRGSFKVLVHRMRKRVEGAAEVVRDEDRLVLKAQRGLAVPDPRCVEPTVARVLRLLASRGATRAEDLAGDLQVSQRTVQMALQQLLADGACQQERSGREIRYRVDDTTFSEPTPWAGTRLPGDR